MKSLLSIAVVSIGAVAFPHAVASQLQPGSDTLHLPGLSQPVEIRRDSWGISHIYAESEHDLFFAQGFNAARDRLFQFEIWRRRATGTMAELIGSRALDHDLGARLLRFRGSLRDELAHYHPRGAEIVAAFVAGINAYIELTEANPDLLPLEFRILGTKPERWTPEIVISRHNGLFRNASREIRMAKIVHSLGPAGAADLLDFQPETPILIPDSSVDLGLLTQPILRYYSASRSSISFEPADVLPAFRNNVGRDSTTTCRPPARCPSDVSPFELAALASTIGSNNWVVAGGRAFNQYPMMANDPHRVLRVPSLRYWVHLVGPGWNVIGGGEPALPGVSIGHNEFGAWGLTIFETDQEDLYVYDTNPQNPRQYRYGGEWVDMEIERQNIAVRDAPSVEVELRYTRHGPVLHQDSLRHKAYALRAAWLEVGGAPYLASLRMDQATSWEEFRAACDYFRTPSENMVWADRNGNIGWQATGITPLRRGWDGMLPVPGDGRYEWDGFLRILDLPQVTNPPEGWIATANANNLPRGYRPVVGYEWSTPFRISRISEVLASGRRLTLMDMQQLQQDELAIAARLLVPLLAP
ncbi:MAG: penicillin acylase family protein, partial [Rhodothermales bacterium]|nr:penicillin acylase family protein [Rhodothermales bacterium]